MGDHAPPSPSKDRGGEGRMEEGGQHDDELQSRRTVPCPEMFGPAQDLTLHACDETGTRLCCGMPLACTLPFCRLSLTAEDCLRARSLPLPCFLLLSLALPPGVNVRQIRTLITENHQIQGYW